MAKKKTTASQPRSFNGMIKDRDLAVRKVAKAARTLVMEALPGAEESFHSGRNPLAMYRTDGEVCWIQPFTKHTNLYFTRGTELADPDRFLKGTSARTRHVQLRSVEDIDRLPIREWLAESVELNAETIAQGVSLGEVLEHMRRICLALPNTKETLTWGRPHFRVGEKIFCGCGESKGVITIGLKCEPDESHVLMKLPGIAKAAYSRPNDGWIAIDPGVFDDWDEIEQLLRGSYLLIAPKRLAKQVQES